MYLQVRKPLGAYITVGNKSYKIPFVKKIKFSEIDLFKQQLDRIKAEYTLSGEKEKVYPAKKVVRKDKKEEVNDSNKTSKSDRKGSKTSK